MLKKPNQPKFKSFVRALYAYKGPAKPTKAEVKPTKSSYGGVDSSSFSTDFGSGFSGLTANPNDPSGKSKTYQTTASLSPELAQIGQTAGGMLGNNLSYLQRDPEQRVSWLTGGNDPMYNVFNEQSKRATQDAIGRQLVNAQQGGITNSTTLGSALGRIGNDDILRRNQILQSTLDYNNNNARADAQLGMGTISGLNGLMTPYGSAAASQLQTAMGSQDQAHAATAAAQNAEAQRYAAAMDQYNAAKAAQPFGGALGAYGSFIDPLGFSVNPGKALGSFAQIAGTALGGFGGLGALGAGSAGGVLPGILGSSGPMLPSPFGHSYFNSPTY